MPYYDIICPTCQDHVYVGEEQPDSDSNSYVTCKGNHQVYYSKRIGVLCTACNVKVFLSSPLGRDSSVTCKNCGAKTRGSAGHEVRCSCGNTLSVSDPPVGTEYYTCGACKKRLDAKAAWKTVPAGESFEIPAGKVVNRETEYESLKSAGLTLMEGGRFKQGERINMLGENKRNAVAAGMCQAQCLHWIRRVLQKGRQVYDTSRDKTGAQRSASASKSRELQHANAVAEVQLLGGVAYSEWEAHAKKADEILVASKKKEPEQVKRQFANIKVTVNQARKNWDSIDAFLSNLFQRGEFCNSSNAAAAILGIDVHGAGEDGSQISGHAIAVLHDKLQRTFLLFDPNYGIFSAGNLNALKTGTAKLIKDVWTKFGEKPWKVTNNCSYTVFAPVVQETPSPPVTIVSATVEAQGMAAQGKLEKISGPALVPPSMEGPPPKPQKVVNTRAKNVSDHVAKVPAPMGGQTANPTSRGSSPPTEGSPSGFQSALAKFKSLEKSATEAAKSKK